MLAMRTTAKTFRYLDDEIANQKKAPREARNEAFPVYSLPFCCWVVQPRNIRISRSGCEEAKGMKGRYALAGNNRLPGGRL